jgi:hypothetical protein
MTSNTNYNAALLTPPRRAQVHGRADHQDVFIRVHEQLPRALLHRLPAGPAWALLTQRTALHIKRAIRERPIAYLQVRPLNENCTGLAQIVGQL